MNTTTTETAETITVTSPVALAQIEAAALPAGLTPASIRQELQTVRTKRIRQLLRSCGIKAVSVTSATGSMCYWTNVRFEGLDHEEGTDYREHVPYRCPICSANRAAEVKVTSLILAAFPDLGDRSDTQTDHFDFVFTVHAG